MSLVAGVYGPFCVVVMLFSEVVHIPEWPYLVVFENEAVRIHIGATATEPTDGVSFARDSVP